MCVKRNRESSESKKLEEDLRIRYKQIAGRNGDCLDGDDGDDESEESENEELYAYDGFSGGTQDIQEVVTNMTPVQNINIDCQLIINIYLRWNKCININ